MNKLLTAFTGTALVCVAAPAMATVVMVDPSSIQGANLLFNGGAQTGTTVFGHTQGGTVMAFTGTTTTGNVLAANGGQARVGAESGLLTVLNFSLVGGNTFQNLEFNMFRGPTGTATGANVAITDNLGTIFNFNGLAIGNGENRVGFVGTGGESIRSVSVTFTGGGVDDFRQIRLDEVAAAVPEPASWAMLLLGFGTLGTAMRRTRRARVTYA